MINMRRVMLLAFFLIAFAGEASGQNPSLDELLWWLPEDTETLFVTRGPYVWKPWKEDDLPDRFEKYIQGTMFFTLNIGKGKRSHGIESPVLLALHGARKFRAPSGLGLMPYEGCEIVIFGNAFAKEREAVLKRVAAITSRRQAINGYDVFVGEGKLEEDTWTFFITSPKPNILLLATHQGYLEEVLKRMGTRASTRALPDNLPEWAEIDRNARVFGLRHFRRDSLEDPTSPFGGQKAGNQPDEHAIGIAFSYPGRQKQVLELSYLSSNTESLEVAKRGFENGMEGLQIAHKQKKSGVITVSIRIATSHEVWAAFFLVSTFFGHGLYL